VKLLETEMIDRSCFHVFVTHCVRKTWKHERKRIARLSLQSVVVVN